MNRHAVVVGLSAAPGYGQCGTDSGVGRQSNDLEAAVNDGVGSVETHHCQDTTRAHQLGQPIQSVIKCKVMKARDSCNGVVADLGQGQIAVEDVSNEPADAG